jgi:hypothetical protein
MDKEQYEVYIERLVGDYDISASSNLLSRLAHRSYDLSFEYDMDESEIKAELLDVIPVSLHEDDDWNSLLEDLADEIVSNFGDSDEYEDEDEDY